MEFIKKSTVLLVAIIIAVVVLLGYHFSYPIELNRVSLPGYIQDFYNRGYSVRQSPVIVLYDGVSIGNREYYLLEIGEDLGYVALERGAFGRYKIEHLGYGGGNFRDGIIEHGGKKYLLFGGRDVTAQIARIFVSIDGMRYDLFTPKAKDHFLLHIEVDPWVEDTHINRGDLVFYNEQGEDITALYDLSGGGIQ